MTAPYFISRFSKHTAMDCLLAASRAANMAGTFNRVTVLFAPLDFGLICAGVFEQFLLRLSANPSNANVG